MGTRHFSALMAFAMTAFNAAGQAQFHGFTVGGESLGNAMSGDGSTAVGRYQDSGFVWTAGSGFDTLPFGPTGPLANIWGVNWNGTRVAGVTEVSGRNVAYVQTVGNAPTLLDPISGDTDSAALGISGDGTTVVGRSTTQTTERAFRWTSQSGTIDLGVIPGGTFATAVASSYDGSRIVGVSGTSTGYRAFLWSHDVGMTDLGALVDDGVSLALAIDRAGSAVAGTADSIGGRQAFLWTPEAGMQGLGFLPGGSLSQGLAVSTDGLAVAGASTRDAGEKRAILWRNDLGMVDLNEYLPTLGIDLTGWTLQEARGISGDGTAMSGIGLFEGETRAWVVTNIPSPGSIVLLLGPALACRRVRR